MLSWFNRNVSGPPNVPEPEPGSKPPVLPPATSSGLNDVPTMATTTTAEAGPSSEQPQKRAFTTALNTPHDAVLAELQGHHPDHDPSTRIDLTPSVSVLGLQSLDTLPAATSEVPGSVVSSSSPPPDGEELWAHLARIRALQAEVAGLHVTMEGIGLGEPAVTRLRSATPRAVGERLADDEDSDGDGGSEVEERRALEFERAERRFDWAEGRDRTDHDQAPQLDELSQALAAFHALDAPGVNFTASRTTTMSTAAALARPSVLRHPDLRRISSDTSVRGHEEIFDSPASLQAPLPNVQESESDAEHADPDTPIS
ncbi:hypothetical protein EDB92DRAFT_2112105 [Lactarius akahatsu]|uniref:Uncharacterized protein n=1 Tax=Lactarius akahatsu TaxID=416441 RepID=A0AAD4LS87_9AGAM|nr:hypothetical protein EDB92DRAFT_2112105 [Lactarius akahatsu]